MQVPEFDDRQELGASMVEEIRRTAKRRLRQIEPLIEEAERLRDVLKALDGSAIAAGSPDRKTAEDSADPPAGRGHEAARAKRADRAASRPGEVSAPRAAKGTNKRMIIELVERQPGITPAQISAATGVKRTVVASTVSRLKRQGELCDHKQGGLALPPADGAKRSALGVGERARRLASLPPRRVA